MVKKAILTVGPPASGKTTWAEKKQLTNMEDGWVILERDKERYRILTEILGYPDSKIGVNYLNFYYSLPSSIIGACENLIDAIFRLKIEEGKDNLIFSNTNLRPRRRDSLIKWLLRNGYEVRVICFHIPFERLLAWDSRRAKVIGKPSFLETKYKVFEEQLKLLEDETSPVTISHVYQKEGNQYG